MNWLLRNTIISADTQKLITAGMEILKLIKLWFRNFSQKYILGSISDLFQTWGHLVIILLLNLKCKYTRFKSKDLKRKRDERSVRSTVYICQEVDFSIFVTV